jgi:hypothetical protein
MANPAHRENAGYFNRFFRHRISHGVGQRMKYQLAPSRHMAACSTNTRKLLQSVAPFVDRSGFPIGCLGIIDRDAVANAL